jgi:zinc transporter, ZIP family
MGEAFLWGLVAGSSLVIGAILALRFRFSPRTIALIMAFGGGVLISALSFDLVAEAVDLAGGHGSPVVGLFAGSLVFFAGDWLIDRAGGSARKDSQGGQESGSALSIVLGTVLDGIPESMVIGLTIVSGGEVSAAYLAAVFMSNLPESIGSSTGLAAAGWKHARIIGLWTGVALVSGIASALGYGLLEDASDGTVAFVQTFAAGAILTMLADTMLPEAYKHGGRLTGVIATLGFATAFGIHLFE